MKKLLGLVAVALSLNFSVAWANGTETAAPLLHVQILGYDNSAQLTEGEPRQVTGEVSFMYAGACSTKSDDEVVRAAVLAGHSPESVMTEISRQQLERLAHLPGKNEGVFAKNGKYSYQLSLTQTAVNADGSMVLTLGGAVDGPLRYDAKAAAMCNGYVPDMQHADIPLEQVVVPRGGQALISLPILGDVRIGLKGESQWTHF